MKSPAFSFYVRDWLCSKTVSKLHSKPHSKGVSTYLYLLCSSWLEEPRASLPTDENELAGLGRVSVEEFRLIWPLIKDQFPLDKSINRFVNERLKVESDKQISRSKAGSKGGSKKVANEIAAYANAIAIEKENVFSEVPSWNEFWAYCQSHACLLPAEWYAKDKWEAGNQDGWQKKSNWRAYARRCRTWWEADGRPMKPTTKNDKINSRPNPRNAGVVGDLAENARKTAEFVRRKQEEREAKNAGV